MTATTAALPLGTVAMFQTLNDVSDDELEAIDRSDWIEKVYYEDGVKITRYKPVWWKEGLSKTILKGKPRKPSFGPSTPIENW